MADQKRMMPALFRALTQVNNDFLLNSLEDLIRNYVTFIEIKMGTEDHEVALNKIREVLSGLKGENSVKNDVPQPKASSNLNESQPGYVLLVFDFNDSQYSVYADPDKSIKEPINEFLQRGLNLNITCDHEPLNYEFRCLLRNLIVFKDRTLKELGINNITRIDVIKI